VAATAPCSYYCDLDRILPNSSSDHCPVTRNRDTVSASVDLLAPHKFGTQSQMSSACRWRAIIVHGANLQPHLFELDSLGRLKQRFPRLSPRPMTELRRALEPRTDGPNTAADAPPASPIAPPIFTTDDFPMSPTPSWMGSDGQQEIPMFPMPNDEQWSRILEFDIE
jgi:hypothetical protein